MSRVLLCSDIPVLSHGLELILQESGDLSLAGSCPSLDSLRDAIGEHMPDLLLLGLTSDMHMGTLARLLHESAMFPKTILWARGLGSELALQALSIGVRAILPRTAAKEALIRCLRRVAEGELWFEKGLTERMAATNRHALTRREGQLVELLSRGLKNKEVAAALGISEGSTKVYLTRLFQKLGVKDRLELALFGLRNLAIGLDPLSQLEAAEHQIPAPMTPRSFFLNRAPIS